MTGIKTTILPIRKDWYQLTIIVGDDSFTFLAEKSDLRYLIETVDNNIP